MQRLAWWWMKLEYDVNQADHCLAVKVPPRCAAVALNGAEVCSAGASCRLEQDSFNGR